MPSFTPSHHRPNSSSRRQPSRIVRRTTAPYPAPLSPLTSVAKPITTAPYPAPPLFTSPPLFAPYLSFLSLTLFSLHLSSHLHHRSATTTHRPPLPFSLSSPLFATNHRTSISISVNHQTHRTATTQNLQRKPPNISQSQTTIKTSSVNRRRREPLRRSQEAFAFAPLSPSIAVAFSHLFLPPPPFCLLSLVPSFFLSPFSYFVSISRSSS